MFKQYDNTFWGSEHHLTQGLCVAGSTPDGRDLTNRLSWLFVEGHTKLTLPEPLLWVRWHENIDQAFFAFCLSRLEQSTCFPMFWNDKAIPTALKSGECGPVCAPRALEMVGQSRTVTEVLNVVRRDQAYHKATSRLLPTKHDQPVLLWVAGRVAE